MLALLNLVTPFVGVWIETILCIWLITILVMSHPSWVCGLKQRAESGISIQSGHTLRGCVDWNSIKSEARHWITMSHPSWVCGLKPISPIRVCRLTSHTLRGCVDWNCYGSIGEDVLTGHTLRGCVDWNTSSLSITTRTRSHTLRGCVDWNSSGLIPKWASTCHTLRGCVDWNINTKFILIENNVTPFVGVWIETIFRLLAYQKICVTPFVGVWIETQSSYYNQMSGLSHPSWVCGLKHLCLTLMIRCSLVTPFVGVWIETPYLRQPSNQ